MCGAQFSTGRVRTAKLRHSTGVGDVEGFQRIVEDQSVIAEFE